MRKFFSFDKMITPMIIQLFFWVGVIGTIVSGIGMIIVGIMSKEGGMFQIISGVICLFLGPLFVRIYCEMLIVFFKMQASLMQISEMMKEKQQDSM